MDFNEVCPICQQEYSSKNPQTRGHIIPESQGGRLYAPECFTCNSSFGRKIEWVHSENRFRDAKLTVFNLKHKTDKTRFFQFLRSDMTINDDGSFEFVIPRRYQGQFAHVLENLHEYDVYAEARNTFKVLSLLLLHHSFVLFSAYSKRHETYNNPIVQKLRQLLGEYVNNNDTFKSLPLQVGDVITLKGQQAFELGYLYRGNECEFLYYATPMKKANTLLIPIVENNRVPIMRLPKQAIYFSFNLDNASELQKTWLIKCENKAGAEIQYLKTNKHS